MARALFKRGVERFAAGDVAEATRLWLMARRDEGASPELEACLKHVAATEPALLARIAAELSGDRQGPAPTRVALGSVSAPGAAPRAARQPGGVELTAEPVVAGGAADPWSGAEGDAPPVLVHSSASGLTLLGGPRAPAASEQLGHGDLGALETRLGELLALDDFSGALAAADEILAAKPEHGSASAARRRCLERLEQMYRSKLGELSSVPRLLMSPDELIWLDLDHRSGFVLAQIDGMSSYEEIALLTGMPPVESYRILAKLLEERVIGT